ncbi:MAG: hypothetical protein FJ249_05380 [Nitrospira sp.]|nr:hypothetical protein [Nitrospira sp.]
MSVEEKWKANQEKVVFMKRFPGLTGVWEQTRGKAIETVVPLPSKPDAAVLVFTDGSFAVAPPLAPEPWELGEGLKVARPALEPKQPQAYQEYDRLVRKDKDALKAARLEKILGAIQNNLEQIPELKDRIKELVKSWK